MPPIETFAQRKTVDLRGRRRLTTAQLAEIDQVGRHPLDDLLYFTVQKSGSRGYELRYLSPETGKRRDMAIGRFPELDPVTARERAAEFRALIAKNLDPLEERRRDQERARDQQSQAAFTLRAALEAHFAIESLRWRNEKYKSQWLSRMFSALDPLLDRPLAAITKAICMTGWSQSIGIVTIPRSKFARTSTNYTGGTLECRAYPTVTTLPPPWLGCFPDRNR